jgi:hypothetical protein
MQNGDARKAPRLKAIKAGQVVTDPSATALDCAIRNISATGALIRFDKPVELPENVELIIVSHNIHVRAHVAWQSGTEAGVEFEPGAVSDS